MYLIEPSGDGVKNTYSFLWYVLHDRGHWFSGMNYPFGEHPNFPDAQPGLAWLVRGLQTVGVLPAGGAAALGALYWTLALGEVAGVLVLFALLRRAAVGAWFATLAALLITFQSPQIDRLSGHMALAYPVVVPGLWLLIVRLTERPTLWRALALLIAGSVASLLTSYYVMCLVLLAGGYAFIGVVFAAAPQRRQAWRAAGWLLLATGLTLGLTLGWLALTDPFAAERPTDPYGFFIYTSSWAGAFLPSREPLLTLWQNIKPYETPNYEGWIYVGIVPAFVLILTAVRILRSLLHWPFRLSRMRRIFRPALPHFLVIGLWVAILTMLFAMAYPFRWSLFERLPDILPPLKQLRALGRFAWLFYYVFTVYAATYLWRLNRYLHLRRAGAFATLLLLSASALWSVDALLTTRRFSHLQKATPRAAELVGNLHSYQQRLAEAHVYASDFQAILPLPAFSLGSEKWSASPAWGTEFDFFRASLQTGLPLAATMMSRTSLRQTKALLSLVAGPLIARDSLLKAQLDARPLLLLVRRDQPLPAAQQRLVRLAQLLQADDHVAIYALPMAAALTDERALAIADTARRTALNAVGASLTNRPDLTALSGLPHPIVGDGWGGEHLGRSSTGAQVQALTDRTHQLNIYAGALPGPPDTLRYEASVWFDLRTPLALPWVHVKQFDASGQQLSDDQLDVKATFEVQGDWIRAAIAWQRQPTAVKLEIYADGDKIIADDLLIRPARTHVWGRTSNGIITRDGYGLNGTP